MTARNDLLVQLEAAAAEGLAPNLTRFLAFLDWTEGEPFELQALNVPDGKWFKNMAAHGATLATLGRLAAQGDAFKAVGVYAIFNKIKPAVKDRRGPDAWHVVPEGKGTKDKDIAQRRALYIDLDPERADGVKGISATAAELLAAADRALAARELLARFIPVEAIGAGLSGNGCALFVALAPAPPEGEGERMVKAALVALAGLLDDAAVKVDTSVSEPKRLCFLPGTVKRKGAHSTERPQRRAAFLGPATPHRLTADELRALVAGLRGELGTDEARAAVDAALAGAPAKGARPAPARPAASGPAPSSPAPAQDGPCRAANEIPVADVASRFGLLDGDRLTCPGCGESDGGVVLFKNGLKCSHNRCSTKGINGFRTIVDLVVEREGLDVPGALDWLRREFPGAIPEKRREAPQQKAKKKSAPAPASSQGHHQGDEKQEAGADDWRADLQQDRTGYRKNLANVALILARDPSWAGCLAFDEFAGRVTLLKCPPSHAGLRGEHWPRAWRDADDVRVALWLQRQWKIEAGPELVAHAVVAVAFENRAHPVREYLEGLAWDGTPRLARWLTTYLGVRETDYSRAVGAFMLRAAVARVLTPGCKVDTMLVLQGEQGAYKSTAIKVLCGAPWFTDDLSDFGSKDAAMQLRGVWFVEVPELGGMVRAEVERVKAFFSRAVERYRTAYGRHVEDQPRQCVFFGTTNADTYLKDETGNRRFWPVLCGAVGAIDLEAIARDRDQLWAEAVADIKAGERWYLDKIKDAKALKQSQLAQEAVRERDAWESCILAYLDKYTPVFVTSAELLGSAIGLEQARWGVADQRRVGAIMRGLRWLRRQRGVAGVDQTWGYVPPYLDDRPVSPSVATGATGGAGGVSTAENGHATDATGTTDGFSPQARGGAPGGAAGPGDAGTQDGQWSVAENIGGIGGIGGNSTKQGIADATDAPDATDATDGQPPAPPLDLTRCDTDELISALREAAPGTPEALQAQEEAAQRLAGDGPKSPCPGSPIRLELEAALAAARARTPEPTTTPPPVSGVAAAPAANDPAPADEMEVLDVIDLEAEGAEG